MELLSILVILVVKNIIISLLSSINYYAFNIIYIRIKVKKYSCFHSIFKNILETVKNIYNYALLRAQKFVEIFTMKRAVSYGRKIFLFEYKESFLTFFFMYVTFKERNVYIKIYFDLILFRSLGKIVFFNKILTSNLIKIVVAQKFLFDLMWVFYLKKKFTNWLE